MILTILLIVTALVVLFLTAVLKSTADPARRRLGVIGLAGLTSLPLAMVSLLGALTNLGPPDANPLVVIVCIATSAVTVVAAGYVTFFLLQLAISRAS